MNTMRRDQFSFHLLPSPSPAERFQLLLVSRARIGACSVLFGIQLTYVGKFWSGKKLANLANCGLFANILPANNFFSEIQNYFSN